MIAKKRYGRLRHPKEAEIIQRLREGMSVLQIAGETGVNRNTVWRTALRRGFRGPVRSEKHDPPLEYSPLHEIPYRQPKSIPSSLPLSQAVQCDDEIIARFMGNRESKEVTAEIYRVAAQFQVGKEQTMPEFAIPSFGCQAKRGAGLVSFEPASLPKA